MLYADVIVNISADAVDKSFQYAIPEELVPAVKIGTRVDIPFGARKTTGMVIGLGTEPKIEPDRIRPILGVSKRSIPLDERRIELADWMRDRYGCTLNQALKTVLPVKKTTRKGKTKVEAVPLEDVEPGKALPLNEEQTRAAEDIVDEMRHANRPCLLFGVTGSGKTEVYMELISRMIADGKQTILLIPEISLTYQNLRRFYKRFGARIGVVNSRQSAGEKYENMEKARKGEIDLMIGPRSALFTPFPALGLIIIDEEHDGAYHSDTTPRYDAGEVAAKICEMNHASLLLGSATPSLESFYCAEHGIYRLIPLRHRAVQDSQLPAVQVVDLRQELAEGNKSVFSRLLSEKIRERLARKEQIMLFLNRRGYAGFVSCRSCGKPLKCPHCDISLTYHRDGSLRCHYCGHSERFPEVCPSCGSPYIAAFGTGTQKVESIVQKAFPEARVLRMDADTTGRKDAHSRILKAFSTQEADILIGTQMIVKGHDFPKVTLVGILAADLSLYMPTFKAAEETFDLLTQASGRAGRGALAGEVIIQTYMPDHYALQTAAAQDYEGFYKEEIAFRELMKYPPCGGMLSVLVLGREPEEVKARTQHLQEGIRGRLSEDEAARMQIIGPAAGDMIKREDIYRQQFFVKAPQRAALRKIRTFCDRTLEENVQCDLL